MTMPSERFTRYAEQKTQRASKVETAGVITLENHVGDFKLERLEHTLIRRFWGEPFYYTPISEVNPNFPAVNLVFVEDKNGNTGSDKPWILGGGDTDFMLYEGLSRVHADAVIGGSETIKDIALSIWHPALVEYRTKILKKRRHPINVITTRKGDLDIKNQMVFNNPELEVVILTGNSGKAILDPKIGKRTWVHVESTGQESDLQVGFGILKDKYNVEYASVIGGRNLATQLIDQDLVHDLYLTHTAIEKAQANTPYYLGNKEALEKRLKLVVSKAGRGKETGVIFYHYLIVPQARIELA